MKELKSERTSAKFLKESLQEIAEYVEEGYSDRTISIKLKKECDVSVSPYLINLFIKKNFTKEELERRKSLLQSHQDKIKAGAHAKNEFLNSKRDYITELREKGLTFVLISKELLYKYNFKLTANEIAIFMRSKPIVPQESTNDIQEETATSSLAVEVEDKEDDRQNTCLFDDDGFEEQGIAEAISPITVEDERSVKIVTLDELDNKDDIIQGNERNEPTPIDYDVKEENMKNQEGKDIDNEENEQCPIQESIAVESKDGKVFFDGLECNFHEENKDAGIDLELIDGNIYFDRTGAREKYRLNEEETTLFEWEDGDYLDIEKTEQESKLTFIEQEEEETFIEQKDVLILEGNYPEEDGFIENDKYISMDAEKDKITDRIYQVLNRRKEFMNSDNRPQQEMLNEIFSKVIEEHANIISPEIKSKMYEISEKILGNIKDIQYYRYDIEKQLVYPLLRKFIFEDIEKDDSIIQAQKALMQTIPSAISEFSESIGNTLRGIGTSRVLFGEESFKQLEESLIDAVVRELKINKDKESFFDNGTREEHEGVDVVKLLAKSIESLISKENSNKNLTEGFIELSQYYSEMNGHYASLLDENKEVANALVTLYDEVEAQKETYHLINSKLEIIMNTLKEKTHIVKNEPEEAVSRNTESRQKSDKGIFGVKSILALFGLFFFPLFYFFIIFFTDYRDNREENKYLKEISSNSSYYGGNHVDDESNYRGQSDLKSDAEKHVGDADSFNIIPNNTTNNANDK